jgi:hypothetical protein
LELLKYASDNVKLRFLNILNLCWITHIIPEEWLRAKIIPIFKNGDRNDCNNYIGICLLTSAYKVYAKIITRRLNVISEALLHDEQHGFRKGRSCSDCVFVMKQIIQKRREFNLETHILFGDYFKAFDRVLRSKLWNIINTKEHPQHLIKLVQSLYKNTSISIDNRSNSSTYEIINQGVRQGCHMSPSLFNIYIDAAMDEWQSKLRTNFRLGR